VTAVIREESAPRKGASILGALAAHAPALQHLRYGAFRGVVKGGKLVVFAIEQEWRPQVEKEEER
jgi:hypothetical protein